MIGRTYVTFLNSFSRLGFMYDIQRVYKFYLSFENSLCRDYVTEKFFTRAGNILPVVRGG